MSLILIADTPQPRRISSLQRILYGHDLVTADFQRAVVESSRLLSDRVSDSVIISENEMTELEDVQLKRETSQTTAEADISDAESHKHCIGQN
ncbi:MAG: hypothetical protein K2X93_12135 [Candidatus Obscuribacterales bacterium]|nr:hypothetical protein [Candidatus Obscuribacterales bacterium]